MGAVWGLAQFCEIDGGCQVACSLEVLCEIDGRVLGGTHWGQVLFRGTLRRILGRLLEGGGGLWYHYDADRVITRLLNPLRRRHTVPWLV